MSERGKRIAGEGDVLDKISDLPSNVIAQILDFLPVKDAARTCVLSTKWRYVWASHPNIKIASNTVVAKERKKGSTLNDFSSIINKILLHHVGPVSEFELEFPLFPLTDDFDFSFLDHWLLYLSRNGIEKLTLEFVSQVLYILPSHIFSSPELKVLNFTNCIFNSPNGHAEFRNLNRFYFSGVKFQSYQVTSAFNTPQLTYLCFKSCTEVCKFKIRAPKLNSLILYESGDVDLVVLNMYSSPELKVLKVGSCFFKNGNAEFRQLNSFCFHGVNFRPSQVTLDTPQLKYISLRYCTEVCNFKIRAPKLKTLVLDGCGDIDLIGFEMAEITTIAIMGECTFKEITLTKLFEKWRLISTLYVCGSFFEYLDADPKLERLRSMTICLKHLILKDIDLSDLHQISCILCLLQKSTTLSRLEISVGLYKKGITNDVLNNLDATYNMNWMINRLEVVIIENARGSEDEMRFIRFLLSWSTRLKRMFVQERNPYYDHNARKLSKNLMRFPRASREAEIILEPDVKIAKPPSFR